MYLICTGEINTTLLFFETKKIAPTHPCFKEEIHRSGNQIGIALW